MLYIVVLGFSLIIVLYLLYQKSLSADVNNKIDSQKKVDSSIQLQPKKTVVTVEKTKKKKQAKKESKKYIEPADTDYESGITKQVSEFNKTVKVANQEAGLRDRIKYEKKQDSKN